LLSIEDRTSTEFTSSLKDTISLSKAINDSSNYRSREEMQFTQAVAANRFEALGAEMRTELVVMEEQLTELEEMKAATENIAENTLALLEMQIGGTSSEVITLDGIVQAIHSLDWDLYLGQSVSEAMVDSFDEMPNFSMDTESLSNWMDSLSTVLDVNNDGIIDAVKGVTDIGEKFVSLDLDSDGVMDIRMVEDSSGSIMRLDLISQYTKDLLDFQTLNLGGQTATVLLDADTIASLNLGEMQITLGAGVQDVIDELSEGVTTRFDWNTDSDEYQIFLDSTDTAIFDWNADGVPDAIKKIISDDGSYTLTYDLDSDDKADLTLSFNNAGILTNIATAEQGVSDSMTELKDQLGLSSLSISEALNGLSNLSDLFDLDLTDITVDVDFTTLAQQKISDLQSLEVMDISVRSEISDSEFNILRDAILESEISSTEFNYLRDAALDSSITSEQFETLRDATLKSDLTDAELDAISNAFVSLDSDSETILNDLPDIGVDDIVNSLPEIGVDLEVPYIPEIDITEDADDALSLIDDIDATGSLVNTINDIRDVDSTISLDNAINSGVEIDTTAFATEIGKLEEALDADFNATFTYELDGVMKNHLADINENTNRMTNGNSSSLWSIHSALENMWNQNKDIVWDVDQTRRHSDRIKLNLHAQNDNWMGGSIPAFAVGTTNVTQDMIAQIHKKEMIIPASFSDGLRNGDLTLGNNTVFEYMANSINELVKVNKDQEQRMSKMQQDISLLRKSQERSEYMQQDILEEVSA